MKKGISSVYTRRKFIQDVSMASIAISSASLLPSCGGPASNEKRTEKTNSMKAQGKLGIALVGLGNYAETQLAPALKETGHCYLAGIVTGTPAKIDKWKGKYNIADKNVYNYQTFDSIKDNPDIDIIYIVLPNAMHAEYVIKAAKAGKHVICEKPMAISVAECDKMIAACKEAGKMLSIGYRLHFEPYNQEMMRLGREKTFGQWVKLTAENGMGDVQGWRLDKSLAGGGPLMDLGIYCVQGCRYTTGLEPIAVTAKEAAKTKPDKFKTIEEGLSWVLEFPGNIKAGCTCSYTKEMNKLRAEGQSGWAELAPAYEYKGIKGETSQGKMNFPEVNQQAKQMDDFAQAIKNNRPTPVPGEMGRQDLVIIEAIYKAMASGQRVEIS
jgi:predicted dehydrogenase